jgi:hypothetical protein
LCALMDLAEEGVIVRSKSNKRDNTRGVRKFRAGLPTIKSQTDGFVPIGEMSNEERFPCLVCKQVTDRVHVNLFALEANDIPAPLVMKVGKSTLAITYRLCPPCYRAKLGPWKIRLLIIERFKTRLEGRQ